MKKLTKSKMAKLKSFAVANSVHVEMPTLSNLPTLISFTVRKHPDIKVKMYCKRWKYADGRVETHWDFITATATGNIKALARITKQ
jgi:predicted SnoaL-like aldol condensation-catalyzing enzyme